MAAGAAGGASRGATGWAGAAGSAGAGARRCGRPGCQGSCLSLRGCGRRPAADRASCADPQRDEAGPARTRVEGHQPPRVGTALPGEEPDRLGAHERAPEPGHVTHGGPTPLWRSRGTDLRRPASTIGGSATIVGPASRPRRTTQASPPQLSRRDPRHRRAHRRAVPPRPPLDEGWLSRGPHLPLALSIPHPHAPRTGVPDAAPQRTEPVLNRTGQLTAAGHDAGAV